MQMPSEFRVLGSKRWGVSYGKSVSLLTPPFLTEGPCHSLESRTAACLLPSQLTHLVAPLLPSPQYKSSALSDPKQALGLQWKPPATPPLIFISPQCPVPFLFRKFCFEINISSNTFPIRKLKRAGCGLPSKTAPIRSFTSGIFKSLAGWTTDTADIIPTHS